MKKLLALALALVMVLGMVGCGEKEPAEKTVKVGIAAPDVTHGWVAGVAYYAEKYCKDNNIDYKMTVSSDAVQVLILIQICDHLVHLIVSVKVCRICLFHSFSVEIKHFPAAL